MFLALPARPSLVETASTTGRPLRRCDLAAMVTAVSAIPFASFPMVLPVAGAMTSTSASPFGPSGSTEGISYSTSFPVICSRFSSSISELPKRVSVNAAFSETMGITVSYSSVKCFKAASAFSWVQKEPHMAKPIRSFLTALPPVLL